MKNHMVPLRRPGAEAGERHELSTDFEVEGFDLYGRHHEVAQARAEIGITRLTDGLHLDLRVCVVIETSCDRTLEPTEFPLEFGESEFLPGPNNRELSVEDWTLNLRRYTEHALPNEVPMQVFCPGTERVEPEGSDVEIDPRWRGLDGIFASGF